MSGSAGLCGWPQPCVPRHTRWKPNRRITVAVGLCAFVDTALSLAVVPLLPVYVEEFNLSRVGTAAILVAYPAAIPLVSLASIALVPRVGGRTVTLVSTIVMTFATIAFAFAPDYATAVLARFLQGCASGTLWAASIAWLTQNVSVERRGREVGIFTAVLSIGSVAGPGIGALATLVGPAVPFVLLGCVSAASTVMTALAPSGTRMKLDRSVRVSLGVAIATPMARAAVAIALVVPLGLASMQLILPVDLTRQGISVGAIALALTVGAGLAALVATSAGKVIDRVGSGPSALTMGTIMALVFIPLAVGVPPTVGLAILVFCTPTVAIGASAMYTLGTVGADSARIPHVVVSAMLGAAWAIGFTVGPLMVAQLEKLTGSSAALLAVGSLAAILVAGSRRDLRRSGDNQM